MRHAKSDWDAAYTADFDRPLNGRGRRDAPRVGDFLADQSAEPDLIVASPARRARATAELAADAGDFACELAFDQRIYQADAAALLEVIADLPEWAERVMLVGHNPGCEELVADLCGEITAMPTAAIACVALDITAWTDAARIAAASTGVLQWHITPKALP